MNKYTAVWYLAATEKCYSGIRLLLKLLQDFTTSVIK